MTTYLAHITGKNVLIDDGKGPRKKRFHSSRLVENANSNAEAYMITGGGFLWLSDKIQIEKEYF